MCATDVAVIVPLRVLVPLLLLKTARRALTALRIIPEHPLKTRHIHLNFITVPLASVLILLAAGVFHAQTLRDGIVGANGIQPLNIMALFISLVSLLPPPSDYSAGARSQATNCSYPDSNGRGTNPHAFLTRHTSRFRWMPPGSSGSLHSGSRARAALPGAGCTPISMCSSSCAASSSET